MSQGGGGLVIARRVLVVEDDTLIRGLLASTLQGHGFEVRTASTTAEAVDEAAVFDPDAALLDVNLGVGATGFDLADVLLAEYPYLAVLFLTQLPDARFAGRDPNSIPPRAGYLHKSKLTEPNVLIDSLEAVLREDAALTRDDRDPQRTFASLSRTQIAILRMVAAGLSNQDIADERGTTLRAVQDTVARCFRSIGVNESAEGHARVVAVRKFIEATGLPLAP